MMASSSMEIPQVEIPQVQPPSASMTTSTPDSFKPVTTPNNTSGTHSLSNVEALFHSIGVRVHSSATGIIPQSLATPNSANSALTPPRMMLPPGRRTVSVSPASSHGRPPAFPRDDAPSQASFQSTSTTTAVRRALEQMSRDDLLEFAVNAASHLCQSLSLVVDLGKRASGTSADWEAGEGLLGNSLTSNMGISPQLLSTKIQGQVSPFQFSFSPAETGPLQSLGKTNAPTPVPTTRNFSQQNTAEGFSMINNYLVLDDIGRGRFGVVMLAADTDRNDKMVAIKALPRDSLTAALFVGNTPPFTTAMPPEVLSTSRGEPTGGSMASMGSSSESGAPPPKCDNVLQNDINFLREVAVMKKIRHKNVVRLHEVIDDPVESKVYLVMQYIERGPLLHFDDHHHCTPLDGEMAMLYMKQLLNAVAYLHAKNVVHCDIKPDNILLGENGRVHLADFGVSRIRQTSDAQGHLVGSGEGTPAFMAPEVISGEVSYDGTAADVWSLGVTFYAMIFGELPFSGETFADLRADIVTNSPMFPSAELDNGSFSPNLTLTARGTSGGGGGGGVLISEYVEHQLRSMLHKNPKERPSAKVVYRALHGLTSIDEGGSVSSPRQETGLLRADGGADAIFRTPQPEKLDDNDVVSSTLTEAHHRTLEPNDAQFNHAIQLLQSRSVSKRAMK